MFQQKNYNEDVKDIIKKLLNNELFFKSTYRNNE